MKKLMISSIALLLAAVTLSAQISLASINTNAGKSGKKEKRIEKEEKKEEKKELKKLEGPQVSAMSKNNFAVDFGNIADVRWKRTTYFDEASFKQDNIAKTAYYDDESNLVGTTSPKTLADLPANAQKNIAKKYRDYNIAGVVFYDDNEHNSTDMMLYQTRFDDEDTYFAMVQKGNSQIVLSINMAGTVSFFKRIH